MKRLSFVAIFLLLLICRQAYSQNDYTIEVQAGKKILKVENLDLAPTTPAIDLLALFPELLARGKKAQLDNYEIKVNDVTVGTGKENTLIHYTLADIKSIEVSANPSSSQQKDGQSGVIKIKLKELAEGVSGSAIVALNTAIKAQPGVTVNYKSKEWALRGSFFVDYNHPLESVSAKETITETNYTYLTDTLDSHKGYQYLHLDALYKPNPQNELHLWATEQGGITNNGRRTLITDNLTIDKNQYSDEKSKGINYLIGAKYTHKFNIMDLKAEVTYEGAPSDYYKHDYNIGVENPQRIWSYDFNDRPNQMTSVLQFVHHFAPKDSKNKINFTIGGNCSYSPNAFDYHFYTKPVNNGEGDPDTEDLNAFGKVLYLSPYIESDNVFENWYLKASLRYQYYQVSVTEASHEPWSRPENYFTAFINLGFQLAPHHHLSFILDRTVKRMQAYQLYPYTLYNPDMREFSAGNPNLQPASVHNFTVNYITDFKAGENNFTFDTEFKYINAMNLIVTQRIFGDAGITYKNEARNDIFAANFLFLYSRPVLSLTFTANYFFNSKLTNNKRDKSNYYNLSLVPSLNFGNGWTASVKFTYNSHIFTGTQRLSDYFYTLTRFSKTWNNKITAYFEMSDNFHQTAEDIYYSSANSETLYYNLTRPSIEVGCQIRF